MSSKVLICLSLACILKFMTGEDSWSTEPVERLVSESIDGTLKDETYDESRSAAWGDKICELVMRRLIDLKKPSRYAVQCLIMQRNGAALHSSTASYFDTANDGQLSYLWPKEKSKDHPNKTMVCLVTVFGVSM